MGDERLFYKNKSMIIRYLSLKNGGADGTRTRDPRRDRPVF